jgi:hypothetical protein
MRNKNDRLILCIHKYVLNSQVMYMYVHFTYKKNPPYVRAFYKYM